MVVNSDIPSEKYRRWENVNVASEKMFYSQIFRPITTARLWVACTVGAIIYLSMFCKLGGNEVKFGQAEDSYWSN